MTATFSKTPILFAALLTVATPVFAGDWRTIPGGVGTDGVCTLYNQNLECVDAARSFLASSGDDGTIRMRVVNVSPNDVLNIRGYPSSASRIIGMIPPNTGGVEYVGKQVGSWVLVRFDNIEGWVHTGFLVPEPGAWRDTSYSYVAVDPYPADGDPFLALRSYPSTLQGDRITKMRNGTLLHVIQRREDGWWFVEMPSGVKGWAKSGAGAEAWFSAVFLSELMRRSMSGLSTIE